MRLSNDHAKNNYIHASAYAQKYGLSVEQARAAVRDGRLNGYSEGEGSFGGTYIEDQAPIRVVRIDSPYRDGKKRCARCMAWLDKSEYSPSFFSRPKGHCRLCIKTRDMDDPVIDAIDKQSRDLEMERQYVLSDRERAERERRVAEHAARVEADGETGNGVKWLCQENDSD